MEQKDPFKIVKEALQNKWQNLSKTEQSLKTIFFESLNLLKSENSKLMKVAYISEDYAQKIPGPSDFSVNSYEFNGGQQKTVSAQQSKSSINFPLEA